MEPDDESAFVFDTGEYNNSGVKGFIKAYKGESEVIIIPGVKKTPIPCFLTANCKSKAILNWG